MAGRHVPLRHQRAAQGRNLKEENKRRDQRLNDPGRYARMLDAYLAADIAHSVDLLADPEWDETRLRMVQSFVDRGGGSVPGRPPAGPPRR